MAGKTVGLDLDGGVVGVEAGSSSPQNDVDFFDWVVRPVGFWRSLAPMFFAGVLGLRSRRFAGGVVLGGWVSGGRGRWC